GAGEVTDTDGAVVSLKTVTVTAAEVVLLPAASRATAVSTCEALVAVLVSQETTKGAAVTSAPRLAPSSLNCTPTTPTLSAAFALDRKRLETGARVVGGGREIDDGVGPVKLVA